MTKYKSVYNKHILGFEKYYYKGKGQITFTGLTIEWFDNFKNFLTDIQDLNNNSANKTFATFKIFLIWATLREYNHNHKFQGINNIGVYKPSKFALTQEEFLKILNIDLKKNKSLEEIRDLFVFQVGSGQRYSDLRKIQHGEINNGIWVLRQKKQNTNPVSVPLPDFCIEILNKYKYNSVPLPVKSLQKVNRGLKRLAKQIPLNRIVENFRKSGNKIESGSNAIYDVISTHTARRTNVTLSMEMNIKKEIAMAVTNHKKSSMFDEYNKTNMAQASKQYVDTWNNKFSKNQV